MIIYHNDREEQKMAKENYRSIYRCIESQEEVKVRRVCTGEYVVLENSGEKKRFTAKELRQKYKYVKQVRPQFYMGSSHGSI